MMTQNKSVLANIGQGIAWAGFWIGLGLFSFQGKGCEPSSKDKHQIIDVKNDLKNSKDKDIKI